MKQKLCLNSYGFSLDLHIRLNLVGEQKKKQKTKNNNNNKKKTNKQTNKQTKKDMGNLTKNSAS